MIAKWIDIDGGKWRIVVNYDVSLGGELAAYIQGYLASEMIL